jgi:hypothetical protein
LNIDSPNWGKEFMLLLRKFADGPRIILMNRRIYGKGIKKQSKRPDWAGEVNPADCFNFNKSSINRFDPVRVSSTIKQKIFSIGKESDKVHVETLLKKRVIKAR